MLRSTGSEKAEVANKRTKVFDGKLLKIYTVIRKLPNGQISYFEEVKHPGAVLVVPFANEKIVFLRQYRPVISRYIWELPAGKIDPGETPAACAKREMREETGFNITGLKKIGRIYTTPGFSDELIYIYRADCFSRGKPETEKDEMICVQLLSPARVRCLFSNGRINDSKTISALSFAGILS